MPAETRARSKASAGTSPPPQQATATQEESVAINWLFFDKSHPENCFPWSIDVPRLLFNGKSQECRALFAAKILKEFSFDTRESSIKFWKPKEPLLLDVADQVGWTQGINDVKDSFKSIPYPRSFATVLEREIDNTDIVHLAITATGSYQAVAVEEHNERHDLATELPEIQRYHRIVSTPGKSPSVGAKSKEYISVQARENEAIHDGRHPPNPNFTTVAPPIQIFHPIFNEFIRLVSDPSVQQTNKDLKQAQEFMHLLSNIDTLETPRNAAIRTKLTEILQVDVRQEPNTDATSADGVHILVVDDFRIPLLIVELKRELGDAGCDPSTQAGLTMRRSWIQEDRKGIRDKCCCPTLMLAGGGPWMGVLGGVFTDKFIVQRLTDLMWVGHSSTEEDARVYRFARILKALRESLFQLQSYYKEIAATQSSTFEPGHAYSRFYPYSTSFTDKDGDDVHFEYMRMLEDDAACVTYQAKISGQVDSPDIVVKFVSRYGTEVHEFLAAQEHAPRLRYCGPLSSKNVLGDECSPKMPAKPPPGLSLGPMQMVVMDYVSDHKLTPCDAREQLRAVLAKLHVAGYVFGDLRRQNILFDDENKNQVKFIDFDWSGRYDMNIRDNSLPEDLQMEIEVNKKGVQPADNYVCYPLNLSKSIEWAAGVEDLEPIRPQHDWDMLDKLVLL